MTSDVLFDASVAVKCAIREVDSRDALRVLTDVHASGSRALLLDLAVAEAANVFWKKARQGHVSGADAEQALLELQHLPLTIISAAPLITAALQLSLRLGLPVYDSLFVAAVQHLGCSAVTVDVPVVNVVQAGFPSIKLLRNWP